VVSRRNRGWAGQRIAANVILIPLPTSRSLRHKGVSSCGTNGDHPANKLGQRTKDFSEAS
jgi:hypothetical protein